ncbi:hypothetical protein [Chenggangzhangella methanolivorans]|uniref:Uncharacterized protein n=1 Tax=Chenggangzhangella methanolivorans TaxID=1437009 RepID=A0A9E6UPY0_9HYPH|nr:hypothetical protein [Chenggangzhangella methanolivorans]QZO01939.1 hypothetical protein K6K41_11845 [Chenggangzhangella methanolivorans]
MAYVTYGPLGHELEASCETATQAVSILTDLVQRSEKAIMVSMHETGAFALDLLRTLADHEQSDAPAQDRLAAL